MPMAITHALRAKTYLVTSMSFNSELPDDSSAHNAAVMTAENQAIPFPEGQSSNNNNPADEAVVAPAPQAISPENSDDEEALDADNAINEFIEPELSSEPTTERATAAGDPRSARVEMVSASIVQMPKNIRPMPAQGTLGKAILNAGIRTDAVVAASFIHPLITYSSRDGSSLQGFTNLEYSAIFRLQNIQVPVVILQDARVVRFLRSKPGAILERLLHTTHHTERLALASHLYDGDIWGALFDEPLSDELVAELIGVSVKTLKSHLKKTKEKNKNMEENFTEEKQ